MTDNEIRNAVVEALAPIIRSLPTKERRSEAASFILALGWEVTRGLESEEFMRGWLDAAAADLDTNPPRVVIVERH